MKISQWRTFSQIAIKKAIDDCKSQDKTEIRKAIDAAYPFGERAYHPYKIWLSERRIALEDLGIVSPKSLNNRLPEYGEFKCKYCRDSLSNGCLFCFRRV